MNVHYVPIGRFDPALGDPSVLRALRSTLPAEPLVYVADSAHCPYGPPYPDAILARVRADPTTLVDHGVKPFVIARNTDSLIALAPLRSRLPIVPIVGTVPAVKPAAAATHVGRIPLLATLRTVPHPALANPIRDHATGAQLTLLSAPSLV